MSHTLALRLLALNFAVHVGAFLLAYGAIHGLIPSQMVTLLLAAGWGLAAFLITGEHHDRSERS